MLLSAFQKAIDDLTEYSTRLIKPSFALLVRVYQETPQLTFAIALPCIPEVDDKFIFAEDIMYFRYRT